MEKTKHNRARYDLIEKLTDSQVYCSSEPIFNNCYVAYVQSALGEILYFKTEQSLEDLQNKLDKFLSQMGYISLQEGSPVKAGGLK